MVSKKMMLLFASAVLDGARACGGSDESPKKAPVPAPVAPFLERAAEPPAADAPAPEAAPAADEAAAPAEAAVAADEDDAAPAEAAAAPAEAPEADDDDVAASAPAGVKRGSGKGAKGAKGKGVQKPGAPWKNARSFGALYHGLAAGVRGKAFSFEKFTMEPLRKALHVKAFDGESKGAPGTSAIYGDLTFAAKFQGKVVALVGTSYGSLFVKSQTGYVTSGFRDALTKAFRAVHPRRVIRRHKDLKTGNPVDVY